MRLISVNKLEVKSNFGGFYYPVYSLVIVNEDGKNTLGRIIGYSGDDKVKVKSKSGNVHLLKYSDVVFYEEPHKPVLSLPEFERLANKVINKYRKEPLTVYFDNFSIDFDVDFSYSTETPDNDFNTVAAICDRDSTNKTSFNISMPYLQYASLDQIKEVILHEVAHLLAPIGEEHGPTWKAIYITMGGNGNEFIDTAEVTIDNVSRLKLPAEWSDKRYGVEIKYWDQLAAMLKRSKSGFSLYANMLGADTILPPNELRSILFWFTYVVINEGDPNDFPSTAEIKNDLSNLYKVAIYHRDFIDDLESTYDLDDPYPISMYIQDNETTPEFRSLTLKEVRRLRKSRAGLIKFINLLEKRFGKLIG